MAWIAPDQLMQAAAADWVAAVKPPGLSSKRL